LRLHNRSPDVTIRISKLGFNDTLYVVRSEENKDIVLPVSPIRTIALKPVTITPYQGIGGKWLGKWLISSGQKISDINISDFFVRQPFQYSVWPGIGTHGKLSAQVVNKFSMNIFGGYSAGVNGFELGGVFNLDKNDVKYVQVAGLFNTVGGKMTGAQVAGLHNGVLDAAEGVQVAGISNTTKGNLKGVQIAGMVNQAKSTTGVQLAGISNVSREEVKGVQIAGIFNHARNLKGLQIGLVNLSDTSSGYSIGLINVVKRNGYYKLSVAWNESLDVNISFKSGNERLYNILLAGGSIEKAHNVFSFGYGIGKVFRPGRTVSLITEITEQNILAGYKNDIPVLVRLQPALRVRLGEKISLFAGPSFSVYFTGSSLAGDGNIVLVPKHPITLWRSAMAWPGGQVGISFL
jgi:hypothetical protein